MLWDEAQAKFNAQIEANKATDNAWKMYRELSMTLEEKVWVVGTVARTPGNVFACNKILSNLGYEIESLTVPQANKVIYEFIKENPANMELCIAVVAASRETGESLPPIRA